MKRQKLVILVLTLLVSLVCAILYYQKNPLIDSFEAKSYDFRYLLRGPLQPNPAIVIVAIDDKSVGELGRFPWTRTRFAQFVDRASSAGAKAIYLDAFFPEPESAAADRAFAEALRRSGLTSLAIYFEFNRDGTIAHVTRSIPLLSGSARSTPHINMFPDSDGVVRSIRLLIDDGQGPVASMSLSAAKTLLGAKSIEPGTFRIDLDGRRIPTDGEYYHLVNYVGPPGTYPRYSFSDVVAGRVGEAQLKDKIVLVGATSLGIYDMRVTPFSNNSPGVEVHANALDAMTRGAYMKRGGVEALIDLVAIAVLGALAAAITLQLRYAISLPLITTLFFGYFGLAYFLFLHGMWISVVYPELSLVVSFFTTVYLRFALLDRKAREVKEMFSSYVSKHVVDRLIQDPSQARVGGDTRVLTVLFSDVENYTGFSEKLPPQEVLRILNEYLAEMTNLVMEHEGTLDKFIGDGIMVFWGAPLPQENHAELAMDCALRMRAKMEELRSRWQDAGQAPLSLRIGINTGEVTVGNIGVTGKKMEYTAIGDNVNLASRLESINKLYGTRLLISDATRSLLPRDKYHMRCIDAARLKGKDKTTELYEVSLQPNPVFAPYEEALDHFRQCRFAEAEAIFADLVERYDDPPSRLFLTRCADYIAAPPPEGWDGVFTALRK
jgi:adenylate cyclase